ncbi:hypothetical protein [Streptomyces sp. NBC_00474]|uniref:hypothetical protein n=1 Tax=Streptomyces sp. NBC_00474 TaxID=2975754 RepID=UPI00224D52C6|nr:hypothetical protein [Streptomyces sp. NBC_00474]MCX5055101.1 hypothetical protein [Streptomyces sp. NBC_00474]
MNAEKRLTASELVEELRNSLDATDGWIPALSGPDGPVGLLGDAGLAEVVDRLQEFAATPAIPASVARQLGRAAESAASALAVDDSSAYGHLGTAFAYVLQAQRAASEENAT